MTSWIGATVQGEVHRRAGAGNQDAWRGASGRFGSMVVVADGLGSKRHAAASSQAACTAAVDAVRYSWYGRPDPQSLVADVEKRWLLLLEPLQSDEIGSTCLLSWRRPDASLLVASIGDGVCFVRSALGDVSLDGHAGWLNESASIGQGHWLVKEIAEPIGATLLATDGVAADLVPDVLPRLTDHLVEVLGSLERRMAWRRLARDLRAWPTPGLGDDRTLVLHLS